MRQFSFECVWFFIQYSEIRHPLFFLPFRQYVQLLFNFINVLLNETLTKRFEHEKRGQ